jgi:hypothetical protein
VYSVHGIADTQCLAVRSVVSEFNLVTVRAEALSAHTRVCSDDDVTERIERT